MSYSPEEIEGIAANIGTQEIVAAQMLRAFAATLRQQAEADHDFKNFHRLLCERFGYAHDEKDWRRDQVSLIEWIARQQAARTQFANPEELADWLESLHEAYADGAVGNRKWEPAQVAARAIRGIGQQAARVDDGMATRALEAALSAQPAPDGDAPCAKCGSSSVDTGFECNDCGHDNAPSAQPAERQGEAVAWLHTVTQGDGETDQALSFSPASFLLDTQLGFRSLGCRPLGYIDTHPAGWPRVWGTSRVADNAKCLLVSFEREPTNDELIAFDDAIKAAAPVGVPEGMVLVPIEPTELMASAAHKSLVTFNPTTVRGYPVMQAARECYAAMLAAAPSAPQGEG